MHLTCIPFPQHVMRASEAASTGNSSKQIGQSSSCFFCSGGGGGCVFFFFSFFVLLSLFISPSVLELDGLDAVVCFLLLPCPVVVVGCVGGCCIVALIIVDHQRNCMYSRG